MFFPTQFPWAKDQSLGEHLEASGVSRRDFLEFFAEIDLIGGLSACPGGDCSSEHSSDAARCHPLRVDVFRPRAAPTGWSPPARSGYDRTHGA